MQRDEHFARLPSETQTAVKEHVQELKDYIQLKQESDEAVKLPMHVLRSEKEFEEYEKLAQNFKVPGALADTPLGAYVREAQRQYTRVREEVKAEIDWLHAQEKRAKALYEKGAPLLTSADAKQAEEWIQQYREVRIPRREEGAKLIENKSGVKDITGVTYELLGRFKQVQDARKSWDQERVERLDTMAKLIRAKIPVTD